jgi:AraC-like DNA-binding protein
MNFVSGAHEVLRRISGRLIKKLLPLAPRTGKFSTAIDGLTITRFDAPAPSENCFYTPAIGIVLQGYKHAVIGNEEFRYGSHYCLVNGVDIPSVNNIIEASPDRPFLAVSLAINHPLAIELSAEIPPLRMAGASSCSGVSVAEVAPELLEAFSRLVEALGNPDQLTVLAPMIIREIHYRVLIGPQGGSLRMISTQGSRSNQIAEAIIWLRENFTASLHVNTLAARVSMATTTFHRHFKQITSLSPLQFQKRLRLYEAQRLMLNDEKDATGACLAVGYESPTQFNREYKRLFGDPPHRNISRLRQGQES